MIDSSRYFLWDSKYATGIVEIDAHHQYLFALTNRLISLSEEGASRIMVQATLEQLEDYTKEHFSYEEKILEQAGYAKLNEHAEHHARLVAQLKEFSKQFDKEELTVETLAVFMRKWLSAHILSEDMKYIPTLRAV